MRSIAPALCAATLLAGPATGQTPARPVGVATVADVEIPYACTPVPEGAQRFYAEVSFANRDIVRAPDLAGDAPPLPGLTAGISGASDGAGSGDPTGDITFRSRWFGYRPGFVVAATRDVFVTDDGELHADELFAADPASSPPNLLFEGSFTFTGGTGRYRNARGSAFSRARQLGDGVHTAFVACGWIDHVGDP